MPSIRLNTYRAGEKAVLYKCPHAESVSERDQDEAEQGQLERFLPGVVVEGGPRAGREVLQPGAAREHDIEAVAIYPVRKYYPGDGIEFDLSQYDPLVAIYYATYQMLRSNEKRAFKALLQVLEENKSALEKQELRELFIHAQNFQCFNAICCL